MLKIAVLTGSVRPNRLSPKVAQWVVDTASKRGNTSSEAQFDLVDIKDADLPPYDEPMPPMAGNPVHEHTKNWAATIAPYDGFIFVCPEYNHGIPDPLKGALDYLYYEWNDKACGFVGFGSVGAARSIAQMRQVVGFLGMADVSADVGFNLSSDFDKEGNFTPRPRAEEFLGAMLDQLLPWADSLKELRASRNPTQD